MIHIRNVCKNTLCCLPPPPPPPKHTSYSPLSFSPSPPSPSPAQEKVDALRVLGADVRPVPAVPFANPDNYNHQVRARVCVCACVCTCARECICACVGVTSPAHIRPVGSPRHWRMLSGQISLTALLTEGLTSKQLDRKYGLKLVCLRHCISTFFL